MFAPDGKQLLAFEANSTVSVWDWASAKLLRTVAGLRSGGKVAMKGNASEAGPVCSPDGNTLMYFGNSNVLAFLDLKSGKKIDGTSGHTAGLLSLSFTPDGKHLVTLASDDTRRKWEAASGKDLGPIDVPDPSKGNLFGGLRGQMLSPDGRYVVELQGTPIALTAALSDPATEREVGQITLEGFGASTRMPVMHFAPNGKLLAVSSRQDPKVEVYDIATGKHLHTLELSPDKAPKEPQEEPERGNNQAVMFSPDSMRLAVITGGKSVVLWDTLSGQLIGSVKLDIPAPVQSGAFSPDGRCLAFELNDGTCALYELASGMQRRTFGKSQPPPLVNDEGQMQQGSGPTAARPNSLVPQPNARVAVAPDGKTLIQAGFDRAIHVWDISASKEVAALKGHQGEVKAVAFAPDGKTFASASTDTTALVWNMPAAAPRGAKALAPNDLDACWRALAGNDAAKAYTAICDLSASPKDALALIKDKVKPAGVIEPKRIEELIGQLDSNQFQVRDKAGKELASMGDQIVPAVDQALTKNITLEFRRRLEDVRGKVTSVILGGEKLREYRAVEVLERIKTPESRQVLESLARGAPDTLLTNAARAALKR